MFCIHIYILRFCIHIRILSSDSVSIFLFMFYIHSLYIFLFMFTRIYSLCIFCINIYPLFIFCIIHQKFLFPVQCWFSCVPLYLYPILFKISDPFPELNKTRRGILNYIKLTTIFTTLKKYQQWLIVTAANISAQSLCSKNSNLLKFSPILILIYSTIKKIKNQNLFGI